MANQILLDGEAREETKIAAAALTPGELVEEGSTAGQVQANSSANDANAERKWVRENRENEGDGVSTDIASGDTCTVIHPESGAVVNARIAHGTNVSHGDPLGSDGAGALQSYSSGRIVAFAGEDINNTSGSASLNRVVVA